MTVKLINDSDLLIDGLSIYHCTDFDNAVDVLSLFFLAGYRILN